MSSQQIFAQHEHPMIPIRPEMESMEMNGSRMQAMMCGGGHNHKRTVENKATDKKIAVQESFYSTVYTCPMHSEVQSEKPGKCPKCGMKLEKKQILMTYACPEKDCEYQKAQPGVCPEHKKELIKTEVKYHCPKCGRPVKPEELQLKAVK